MTSKTVLFPLFIALALLSACNIDTTSVVEQESRLSISSLFAINGNNSVTLGWTTPLPPFLYKSGAAGAAGLRGGAGITGGPGITGGANPDAAGDPKRILIYRGNDEHFQMSDATLLASVDASVGSGVDRYTDTTVVNGNFYYYRVVPVGELPGGYEKTGTPTAVATGKPYDYSSVTAISYSEHIDRIFSSGCAVSGCHAGTGADAGPFSLKSWEDLLKGDEHGAEVIAFSPSHSHLLFHLNDDTTVAPVSEPHMPLPAFQLPADQMGVLSRWIAEGCRNDHGAVPFSVYPQGRVLITNQAEDLVAVIDRATNLVARYVRAGAENVFTTPPEAPHNVTADAARGVYYVNLIGSGKVLKYRLDDNALIDQVDGILSPTQVAVTASGDTAYVAQFTPGVNAIKILGTNPMRVIGEVSSGNLDKPHGVQITPDGKELWVTGNLSDNIMVVNLADFSTMLVQLNNQPPGQGGLLLPYQTVMTSDNKKVYVTNQRGNTVTVVDRQTYEVIKTIPVGLNPLIPSITPDDRYVLVPNRNTDDVSVIDTRTDTVAMTIPDAGPQPHGSAVTPDGRYLYVSCENVTALVPPHHPTVGSKTPGFFTVIDLSTMRVVDDFEIGAFAAGVAITDR